MYRPGNRRFVWQREPWKEEAVGIHSIDRSRRRLLTGVGAAAVAGAAGPVPLFEKASYLVIGRPPGSK